MSSALHAGPGIKIEILNPLSAPAYAGMMFPFHLRALNAISADGPYLAIGATLNGLPIGLAFGAATGPDSEMHSLFVAREERRRGVGTMLLTRLEENLRRLGTRRLRCGFMEKSGQTPAFVRVLKKCGWQEPKAHKIYAKFTVARMLEAPFIRDYELPLGFRVVLWRNLTAAQRATLHEECNRGNWVPPRLVPFRYEISLEERNSLALLSGERVVGWQLTQRLQPSFITYSSSYVQPRLQTRGLIFQLYVDTVRLHAKHMPEIAEACLVVPMDFAPMVAFVRRRFDPFLNEIKVMFEAFKESPDDQPPSPLSYAMGTIAPNRH